MPWKASEGVRLSQVGPVWVWAVSCSWGAPPPLAAAGQEEGAQEEQGEGANLFHGFPFLFYRFVGYWGFDTGTSS